MKMYWLALLSAVLMIFSCSTPEASDPYLLIGTYTKGKSKGIYVYKFNTTTADFTQLSETPTDNPSYLVPSADSKFVYAVNEGVGNKGSATAFTFDADSGTLKLMDTEVTGDHPCYINIDKSGKTVLVANYTGGSLTNLPVAADGSLESASQNIQFEGHGPNADRQEKPHIHSVLFSPDEKFVFVQDLGTDKIHVFEFGNGKLTPYDSVSVDPGAGPRHLIFSDNGKYAYLIEEMGGNVLQFSYDGKGHLKQEQIISAVTPGYTGAVGSADIHLSPDGRFLYASNRYDDNSLAIFSVDSSNGSLSLKGHQSTMGKIPRNFSIDPSGNYLLVANQESDNIVIFKRNKETGMLTDTGKRIDVGNPVCLRWIEK